MFEKINKQYSISLSPRILLELSIATIIFIAILFGHLTLWKTIAYMLSFIVIMEVTRMLIDFVTDKNHVIKLRLVIDGFIIFFLRDVVLIVSDEKYTQAIKEEKLFMVVSVLIVFFVFRILTLLYSPNDKNCDKCISFPSHLKD